MLKKGFSLLIALALSIAMFSVLSTSVNAQVSSNYEIELLSSVYAPASDEQNWTYKVTCINDPGISHLIFEFKTICDPPLGVVDSAGGAADIEWMYTANPSADNKVGLKFENFPTVDGSIQAGEHVTLWFATDGEWPVGTIDVWMKAANNVEFFRVDGPDCKMNNIIPEVPFGSIMAGASMLVALVAYSIVRKRNSKQKVQ